MKKTREQSQAELQSRVNKIIRQLLNWTDETPKPNQTQIEDIVLKLRDELSQAMVEIVLSTQEAVQAT